MDNTFWKKYIEIYDRLNDVYPYRDLIEKIIDELKVCAGEKILDAGGGTGNVSTKIIELGARVVLLDNSEEAIKYFLGKNKKSETIKHDLRNKLPFSKYEFDKIVCNNTLYILETKFYNQILREFNRVLRGGGLLILSNPIRGATPYRILLDHFKITIQKRGFLSLLKDIFTKIKYLLLILYYNHRIKSKSKTEYHFFGPKEQEELLSKNNFRVIKSIKVYSNQNILTVAVKK